MTIARLKKDDHIIFWADFILFTFQKGHTVFPRIVSVETILFWIWPYVQWPLVTVHTGAETIQGRKLFVEIRYSVLSPFHFDHILKRAHSIWSHSKKSTFHLNTFWKEHIPFRAHSNLITLQKGYIIFWSHSKKSTFKGTFHLEHIPKRAQFIMSIFHFMNIIENFLIKLWWAWRLRFKNLESVPWRKQALVFFCS